MKMKRAIPALLACACALAARPAAAAAKLRLVCGGDWSRAGRAVMIML